CGTGAADRPRHLPHDRPDLPRRHDLVAGRAECPHGPPSRRIRLCAEGRRGPYRGQRRGPDRRRCGAPFLSRRHYRRRRLPTARHPIKIIAVDYLIDLVIVGISIGMVYGLVALGISFIYSGLDIVHFAHGEIYMIGAFLGVTALHLTGLNYPALIL